MNATALVSVLALAVSVAAVFGQRSPAPFDATHAAIPHADETSTEKGRSRRVCRLLEHLLPEVRRTGGDGAHARVVVSIAEVFGNDPITLGPLAATIDEAASESCPLQRQELLSLTQRQSLRESIR